MHGPVGHLAFTRRENALAHAVQALPQAVEPLGGEAVVRRDLGRALVDDARPGVEVVVDALTDEAILPVEEDDLALGHRRARIPIELDPIGEEAAASAGDLHIAGGKQEVRVAADLLDPVGYDTGLAAAIPERDRSLLGPHFSWVDAEKRDHQGQGAESCRESRGQTGIRRLF